MYLRSECKEERHKKVAPSQKDDILIVPDLTWECVQSKKAGQHRGDVDSRFGREQSIMTRRILTM